MTSFHSLSYCTMPSCLYYVYCHTRQPTAVVKHQLLSIRIKHESSANTLSSYILKQQGTNAWQRSSSQGWCCPSPIPVSRSTEWSQGLSKFSWTGIHGKTLSQKPTSETFNFPSNLCALAKVKVLIHFFKNVRDQFEEKLDNLKFGFHVTLKFKDGCAENGKWKWWLQTFQDLRMNHLSVFHEWVKLKSLFSRNRKGKCSCKGVPDS